MKMTKEEYEEARRLFVVMWMNSAGIADMRREQGNWKREGWES